MRVALALPLEAEQRLADGFMNYTRWTNVWARDLTTLLDLRFAHPAMGPKRNHSGDVAVGNTRCIQFIQQDWKNKLLRGAACAVIDKDQRTLAVALHQFRECR